MQQVEINWDDQPLGMVPDAELARQLGVVKQTVAAARAKRGIPRLPHQQLLLLEIVQEHLGRRRCKPFYEIYAEVRDDFGSVPERRVRRALESLVAKQIVARIMLNSRLGGYVLSDSPLLKEEDGYALLRENLVDTLEASGYGQWGRWEPEYAQP
jgi:Fe2+ or Zn2+ uptake regulation protein